MQFFSSSLGLENSGPRKISLSFFKAGTDRQRCQVVDTVSGLPIPALKLSLSFEANRESISGRVIYYRIDDDMKIMVDESGAQMCIAEPCILSRVSVLDQEAPLDLLDEEPGIENFRLFNME